LNHPTSSAASPEAAFRKTYLVQLLEKQDSGRSRTAGNFQITNQKPIFLKIPQGKN